MHNLIPVRRMDKNGVMTTKWVSPDAEASSDRGSLPAPSLPYAAQTAMVYSPRYGRNVDLVDSQVGVLFRKSMLKQDRALQDFDTRAFQAVELMMGEAAQHGVLYQADNVVSTAFNMVGSRVLLKDPDPFVPFNNVAVFGAAVVHRTSVHFDLPSLLLGVKEYVGEKDFLLDASDDEREKALLLVTAAARIKEPMVTVRGDFYDDDRTISIESRAMNEFILSRPVDLDRIVDAVNERGTLDVEIIRDVLDHGQQSLRGGVL